VVSEVFGENVTVRWSQCIFKPKYIFVDNPNDPKELRLSPHSVLEITMPDGNVFVLDGSTEQYGVELSFRTALMTMHDFEMEHKDPAHGLENITEEIRAEVLEELAEPGDENDFWRQIGMVMTEFLEDINWEELRGLEPQELIDRVYLQAKKEFEPVVARLVGE
jgi:hypothetical protein